MSTTTTNLRARLAETIGVSRVVTVTEELPAYVIDGLKPAAVVRPASAGEVAEAVRFAVAERLSIVPLGSRSKCDLGMPPSRYDIAVDMTAMREVAHYDPGDLTLSIDAGMPLHDLHVFLQKHGQFLPLAVPGFECTTAGGTIASGIDSALRMHYGTARDFVIGAEFVDGMGQQCRSGGRVVKNVTGYDLHKLLIGSRGTLGIITRLNFRTFPIPAACGGHIASFEDCQKALAYRKTVDNSGLPLSNLEVLSPMALKQIATDSANQEVRSIKPKDWCVVSCFEGNDAVVRRIACDLQKIASTSRAERNEVLQPAASEIFQVMLREAFVRLKQVSPAATLLRIAVPEVRAETLLELSQLASSALFDSAILVRAAGIIYFAALASNVGDERAIGTLANLAQNVKRIASQQNGYASVLHAPASLKANLSPTWAANRNASLDARVKHAFDPNGIFCAGRAVGGL